MPKTPTFGSERVSLELHCDSSLSSLAASCSQVGEAQLWQRGFSRVWSATGMWLEDRGCCWPAAPSTCCSPCSVMSAHHPEARNELHPCWSPGPASAQHTAMLLPTQLLSGELPGKGSQRRAPSTEQPCEAIPQTTCGKQPVLTLHKSQQVWVLIFQHSASKTSKLQIFISRTRGNVSETADLCSVWGGSEKWLPPTHHEKTSLTSGRQGVQSYPLSPSHQANVTAKASSSSESS